VQGNPLFLWGNSAAPTSCYKMGRYLKISPNWSTHFFDRSVNLMAYLKVLVRFTTAWEWSWIYMHSAIRWCSSTLCSLSLRMSVTHSVDDGLALPTSKSRPDNMIIHWEAS
jgi:hypothetical protein